MSYGKYLEPISIDVDLIQKTPIEIGSKCIETLVICAVSTGRLSNSLYSYS
jgi:hypothetical protein